MGYLISPVVKIRQLRYQNFFPIGLVEFPLPGLPKSIISVRLPTMLGSENLTVWYDIFTTWTEFNVSRKTIGVRLLKALV